jgi:hypothetical protein
VTAEELEKELQSYQQYPGVKEAIPDTTNPKDLLGVKKVSTSKFPAAALIHGAHAMMNGADKYGPYNWRGNKVRATIYLDACERHLIAYREREQIAADSGVHHLGHAIACLAIILDAEETGNLIDDRPEKGEGTLNALSRINRQIETKNKKPSE